ncbi:hypothetical protein [Sphingobium sp.]|uniref:hypothetical protein n=1 Tax=Sphingobium sp. TaxID=1912891 RepID=UPI002BDA3E5E|nr:hypothetical protein [Sphingobium sp.]HUD91818.1 hypothetical protein [Sphingobium sp.]
MIDISDREFEFSLKLRVECPNALWKAAAHHCLHIFDYSNDDMIDLIGPAEDPSIEDCLMLLALPARMAGCAMLSTTMDIAEPAKHVDG